MESRKRKNQHVSIDLGGKQVFEIGVRFSVVLDNGGL
jgi:hypothetical protein